MYYIGVDLGGTNIAVGVVNEKYEIIGRSKIKTGCPRPAEEIIADTAKAAKLAVQDAQISLSDVKYIGIGAPGSINPKTGAITFSNNLNFENVPFVDIFKKYINSENQAADIRIFIENDANAAALGEFLAGAGKGTENFIAITLGTGVGSGIIVNKKLLTGCNYAGGELGHTVIVTDGAACTCGRKGCFEAYASATGIIRLTKEKMLEFKDSLMWQLVGGDINAVDGLTAYDAKRKNDKAGMEVVADYQKYVACGITNAINIFQPEVLCIGGGISKEGDNILDPVTELIYSQRFSKNTEKQTEIKIASLGNDAGIIGAAYLWQQNL